MSALALREPPGAEGGSGIQANEPGHRNPKRGMEPLVDRFLDPIRTTVRKAVMNDHLADDLTQEAFLRIQRALPGFDPGRAIQPWVFTIVANLLRDHWRARNRRRDDPLGETLVGDLEGGALESPVARLEQSELAARIRGAIERVPPGMRRVLEMRFYDARSFEEIAEVLGTSVVTARKRHSRGLQVLRSRLQDDAPVGVCA